MSKIETEELEDFKLKVIYTADPDAVKAKTQLALNELREMNIPGFRPGKATDLAIKMRFKDRIEAWVKNELLSSAHNDVVFETKMRPIGKPQIDSIKLNGSLFEMQAVYCKKPDFELAEYKGLDIPEPHIEKSVSDRVNEFLQTLRVKHGDVQPYGEDDFVQDGDTVTIEYTVGDEHKEGEMYKVGSKLFENFDENLYGMKCGDVRNFKVKVLDSEKDCSVTLHMGLKSALCPLNEELAKRCGVESIDDVTNSVKTIAENQFNTERQEKIVEQVKLRLLELHKFDPPKWLTDQESEYIARTQGLVFAELGDELKAKITRQAVDNVRFTLIVDSIKQKEPEVQLADNEALEGVKYQLQQKGVQDIQGFLNKSYKDGSLFSFIEKLKNDYTIQFLVDKANIIK